MQLEVKKFEGFAVFKQRIKLTNPLLEQIEVMVDYQVCDDQKCIPADYTFLIGLGGTTASSVGSAELDDRSKALSQALDLKVSGWDDFEEETIKEKSNLSIFFLGFLGGLIAFRILSSYVTNPILRLTNLWQNFQETSLALERLSDIVDSKNEKEIKNENLPFLPNIDGQISFRNVSFKFNSNQPFLLKNII